MSIWNLERIPLPDFSTYVACTIISLIGSVIYVFFINFNDLIYMQTDSTSIFYNIDFGMFLHSCIDDSWCFWSCTNFCYFLLICAARELQNVFFGQLRDAENVNIRENFSSYIFYKIVFIYGIINVSTLVEFTLWVAWFSVLGFLRLLTGLIKDRFQFIIHSLDSSPLQFRMLLLCCSLLLCGNFLFIISIIVGTKHSLHIMFFMIAEVFQLLVMTIYIITWYVVYLFCESRKSINNSDKTYHRSVLFYYTKFIFVSILDLGDVTHNVHMLLCNSFQFNMSTIIIGMHLQHMYYKISKRFYQHRRYKYVLDLLESKFIHIKVSILFFKFNLRIK